MSSEDKDVFKFRVFPWTANIYFAWSKDKEIVLRGRGIWKFVDEDEMMANTEDLSETDRTKKNLD